jgi:hypothetical protein
VLLGYGFALEDNACNEVMVRLGRPPDPVLQVLRSTLPLAFAEPWDPHQCTFHLRGPEHFTGGYDHGIKPLRGVPIEMFHVITEMAYFMSTNDPTGAGDVPVGSEQFSMVLEEFIFPLRQKLQMIAGPQAAIDREPRTAKERFARIYRDGQLAILQSIIGEMEAYLQTPSSRLE